MDYQMNYAGDDLKKILLLNEKICIAFFLLYGTIKGTIEGRILSFQLQNSNIIILK